MNPFSPQLPVMPQFFVNRSEIIAEFKKKLIASGKSKPPRPDNMAVLRILLKYACRR